MYIIDITIKKGGRKEYVGRDGLPTLPVKGDVIHVDESGEMAYVKAVEYHFHLEKAKGGRLGEVSFYYPRICASE